MARMARILVKSGESGVYHVCSRVSGEKNYFPLAEKENRHRLLYLIKHN